MTERMKKSPCDGCPRRIATMHMIEQVREMQNATALAALDDEKLASIADEMYELGVIEDRDDHENMRELINQGFDIVDYMEKRAIEARDDETKLCIGVLKIRAKSGSTQYDVALCRHPNHGDGNGIESARVSRTSI